jgi:thiamine-phosphate pyrophosphorylase
MELSGMYAITDEILTPDEVVVEKVQEALETGISIIQYRNKSKSDDEIREVVKKLRELVVDMYGATFILNDRVDLAIEVGASGIHIGENDMELIQVRKKFDGIIGVSCYGDIEKAKNSEKLGANYVAFGSFFLSGTKPNSKIVELKILEEAKKELTVPICAIGGISCNNISLIRDKEPDMIAMVSAIWGGDIKENVKMLSAEQGVLIVT